MTTDPVQLVPWYCNTKTCGGRKVLETFAEAEVWCEKGHICSKKLMAS